MRMLVGSANQGVFSSRDITNMHRLRFNVFRGRLRWDIPAKNEQDRDDYDGCNPVFLMVRDDAGDVIGCCRLLPTTGPYMLKDTFPQLLGSQPSPEASNIWEISRFAFKKNAKSAFSGFGFSSVSMSMISEIVGYGLFNNLQHYVFVTTVAFERMLLRMGVNCERFSEPQQIGVEKSVALWMHIDDQTMRATGFDTNRRKHNNSATREFKFETPLEHQSTIGREIKCSGGAHGYRDLGVSRRQTCEELELRKGL